MTSQDERIAELEVLRAEQRHMRELRDMDREALRLQAAEYERRLAALNHEAEQLKRMQATYMPREAGDALGYRVASVEKSLWRISGALVIVYIVIQFLQKYKIF